MDADCDAREGYLAGSDLTRMAVIERALARDDVDFLWASRGGYGATRLLRAGRHAIEGWLREHPVPLVGFSDITALHGLWARCGVRSIHGPMVARMGDGGAVSPSDEATLRSVLAGETQTWAELEVRSSGTTEGFAAGGNLAVLSALCGTVDQPHFSGAVVFLEDVGERPYRVDRMLTQLLASGVCEGARAFVLGSFSDCEPGPDGRTVAEVLDELLLPLGVPVLAGAPFGHADRCAAFAMGDLVRVRSEGMVHFEPR